MTQEGPLRPENKLFKRNLDAFHKAQKDYPLGIPALQHHKIPTRGLYLVKNGQTKRFRLPKKGCVVSGPKLVSVFDGKEPIENALIKPGRPCGFQQGSLLDLENEGLTLGPYLPPGVLQDHTLISVEEATKWLPLAYSQRDGLLFGGPDVVGMYPRVPETKARVEEELKLLPQAKVLAVVPVFVRRCMSNTDFPGMDLRCIEGEYVQYNGNGIDWSGLAWGIWLSFDGRNMPGLVYVDNDFNLLKSDWCFREGNEMFGHYDEQYHGGLNKINLRLWAAGPGWEKFGKPLQKLHRPNKGIILL